MSKLPSHAVIVSKLPGAPYSSHSLYVDGTLIRSQLSPYTDDEIAEYIREHLQPSPPLQPSRTHYSKSGPKAGKRESETWRTPEDTDD